ncbi:MAG: DEAD/DEAH box helicase [Candidatus Nomurabacteria bacterium]
MFNKTNGRASNGRSFSRDGGEREGGRKTDDRRSKSFGGEKKREFVKKDSYGFGGSRVKREDSRDSRASFTSAPKKSYGNSFGSNSESKPRSIFGRPERSERSGGFGSGEKRSFGGRSSGSSRGGFGRGGGRGGGRKNSVFNDISKFINKSNVKEVKNTETTYIPENSFASLNIDEKLKNNILENGYLNPTMIQDKSVLSILAGKDLVGIANTGTGKTAAFLIPLINKALQNRKEMVIILAPTRELAVQIDNEFKKFSKGLKMWSICAVGGMPIFNQIKDFKYDHNFVIGTPGRLKDLIDRGVLNIKEFNTIVLDESDRMLDMGFVDDMKFLMNEMPKGHQTIFFSATVSPTVNGIIKQYLVDPVSIYVKTRDTAESIDQDVIYTIGKEKMNVLHELLLNPEFEKVIIFGKTKSGVDRIQKQLKELGHGVIAIHGDKRPRERNFALKSFKENNAQVLIATDVAARGLDIPNVSHVINYDLPSTYEDYIHRIGRTGRAGKIGKALTFVE